MQYGSSGERIIQSLMASEDRANKFYDRQMCDHLSAKMIKLIQNQEMMFIATSDSDGNCDCSPRFGHPGFVLIIDKKTLAYPEYRGNGVFASLGNITENPHIGIVFVDFYNTTVGLHVNGSVNTYSNTELPSMLEKHFQEHPPQLDSAVEQWVVIKIDEAYIHCSKHIPLLEKKSKTISWGTDDPVAKSTNYFNG